MWQPEQRSTNIAAASRCSGADVDSLLAAGGDAAGGRGEEAAISSSTARPRHRVRQHRGDDARPDPHPSARLCALALAACGERRRARPASAVDAFTITLDDYLIRPQDIARPERRELTLTVINRGRLGHTFRIRGKTRACSR